MSNKLIPNNRMEEYLNWLGGNTPKGETLNPQNRQEEFLEQIAVRLDNGTGGGGGSGFVELDSMEAAKEFAVAENEGKIAQYVGSSDEVDGSCEYVDRLTISVNEEVFKNKAKGIAPTQLVDSTSYDGLYLTTDSVIDFSSLVGESEGGMYMFGIEDSESYTQPLFAIMAIPAFCEHDTFPHMLVMFAPNFNGYPDGGQALFNCTEWIEISEGSETMYMGVLYAADNGSYQGHPVTKGWHCNQGNLIESSGSKVLAVEGDGNVTFLKSILFGLKESDGAGVYSFKFNGQWTPAIAEYGVSVQGAMDGDEVEVNYNGDGLYKVGVPASIYLDTSKNFDDFEDGTLLAGSTESFESVVFTVSDHCLIMDDDDGDHAVICDSVSGWNAQYAVYIPYMFNIFPITPIEINNQESWKDIISAAPLPNFEVKQKLANRIEVEVDADTYISTVEGKGTEEFTYDNGQWVVYGVAPGTTIDGAIIACEATTIYCNTITSVDDMNKAIADVIPQGSEQHAIVEYTGGGSGSSEYMYAFNQMGTYGGCFAMCSDLSEPGMVFNGAEAFASYLGGVGFLVDAFDTQPRSEIQLVVPAEYKALVDSMFSLTPFQAQKTVIDIDAKGITVKGTPINGDKLVVEYKDGELEKYELYRVQNIEGSKYFEAGDDLEVMYFDTTTVPSNLAEFPFVSGGGAIFVGENGIMSEGLYWAEGFDGQEGEITIGTKLITGSGMIIDPSTVVYTSSKGWVKNSTIINKTKLVESWTFQGMTINSDIEGAKKFVTKVPAGEEPEAQLELYKFYVSPGEGDASGQGIDIVDFGTITVSEDPDHFSEEVSLTSEAIEILNKKEYCIGKFVLTDGGEHAYTMYAPLDVIITDSYYGAMFMFGGKVEMVGGMIIGIQAALNQGMAQIAGEVEEQDVKADSVNYITYEPSEDNNDGLKFVVLSSEPSTYYNGYYYIITQ